MNDEFMLDDKLCLQRHRLNGYDAAIDQMYFKKKVAGSLGINVGTTTST